MRTCALIAVAFLFAATLQTHAQQKKATPAPTPQTVEVDDVIRINTDLVQTDVMVLDKDGRFVNGLELDQFELLVDGKPQPIAFFENVSTGGESEVRSLKAASGKPAPGKSESGSESTSERGRTVIFFVNDLFLEPGSLARVHKTVSNFIDNVMSVNDQLAITSASGQIGFLQQLTNNREVLHAALERLKFVPGLSRDSQRPAMSEYAAYLLAERNDRALFDYFVERTVKLNNIPPEIAGPLVEQRSRAILRQSDAAVKNSLSTLVNLMRSTAKLPGRKLVFFISDGFVPNLIGSDFTTMLRRATDSANRSSVVIYSLDARGLTSDSSLDASTGGGFDSQGVYQNRMAGERTFSQEPLHALAADTGGRALLNSNDLTGGLQRALDETSRYYLLGWRPENEAQRSSNFSKIKVNVLGRPELKVQVRRGYLGLPQEKEKAKAQTTPVTVESISEDTLGVTESSSEELRTALALGYKQTNGSNMQLQSAVQVSAQSPGDGGGTLVVNVLGAVFDSRGKAVGSFKQRVEVQRTRAGSLPIYTGVNHQLEVSPGLYQVRVITAERGTNHLTGAMEWIVVPQVKPGAFSISSLYVGEITETGGSGQVGVNASRRFARNSRLRFTTYIYNAATPPQLTAQLTIRRGNEVVLAPPEITIATEKVSNFTTIPYAGEFPLSTLAPGGYLLELTVTDRKKQLSASQQLDLVIY